MLLYAPEIKTFLENEADFRSKERLWSTARLLVVWIDVFQTPLAHFRDDRFQTHSQFG